MTSSSTPHTSESPRSTRRLALFMFCAKSRSLMLASDNILKPADGHVVSMPSQDMILGLYYLTTVMDGAKGQGRVFSSYAEAQMALDLHEIDMQAEVLIRLPKDFVLPTGWEPREITVVDPEPGSPDVVKEERFHGPRPVPRRSAGGGQPSGRRRSRR